MLIYSTGTPLHFIIITDSHSIKPVKVTIYGLKGKRTKQFDIYLIPLSRARMIEIKLYKISEVNITTTTFFFSVKLYFSLETKGLIINIQTDGHSGSYRNSYVFISAFALFQAVMKGRLGKYLTESVIIDHLWNSELRKRYGHQELLTDYIYLIFAVSDQF